MHKALRTYLRNLSVSPAVFFASSFLEQGDMPATSPKGEQYIEQAVDRLLQRLETDPQYDRFQAELRGRNKDFIVAYFGLNTGIPLTYQAIGNLYGLSWSRVRSLVEMQMLMISFRERQLIEGFPQLLAQ